MYLKSDFAQALANAVAAQPAVAPYFQAGDPTLIAQIDAMATMLAMMSQQVDVAETEPFLKARDGTVLADASLKGVLPLGKPARVQLTVANPGTNPVTIGVGRAVLDSQGTAYVVDTTAVAPAGGSVTITAQQLSTRTFTNTVSASVPFYEIQVPPSADGLYLCGIDVTDADGDYTYTPEFCNVAIGQRVFHVETDEYRNVFLRFGAEDATAGLVIGHQPVNGDILTVTIRECSGAVNLATGSGFSLQYVGDSDEALLTMTLASVIAPGSAPPDTDTLRMLSRYPALVDSNAVFLGDFDFLLRRQLGPVTFISVWNEQVEEAVRGPSLANINKLFVAYVIPGQTDGVSQDQISRIIARADDSYGIVFVGARYVEQPITVTASVAAVHDTGAVSAQIITTLLANYGAGSVAASRGLAKVLRLQQVNADLKAAVPALQDQISDFSVVLGASSAPLPEDFRYLSAASITVNVTRITDATGLWSL